MGFLKENKNLIVFLFLSTAVAVYGTFRDDRIGIWCIAIGLLITLLLGLYGYYSSYKDKKEFVDKITSLKNTNESLKNEVGVLLNENEKLKKDQKTLEESLNVERDSEGNVVSHIMTWGEF